MNLYVYQYFLVVIFFIEILETFRPKFKVVKIGSGFASGIDSPSVFLSMQFAFLALNCLLLPIYNSERSVLQQTFFPT